MSRKGFTLAELLIALAILGVIATFTIPKVLNSASSGQNTAIAKEAASMVSGAFATYQQNNSVIGGSKGQELTPFMNYVKVDTATDYAASSGQQGTALDKCSDTLQCLVLHNGGILQYDTGNSFAATAGAVPDLTNAIYFNLDPDAKGIQGAVTFVLYSNGRLTTYPNRATGHVSNGASITTVGADPSYLTNWN